MWIMNKQADTNTQMFNKMLVGQGKIDNFDKLLFSQNTFSTCVQ